MQRGFRPFRCVLVMFKRTFWGSSCALLSGSKRFLFAAPIPPVTPVSHCWERRLLRRATRTVSPCTFGASGSSRSALFLPDLLVLWFRIVHPRKKKMGKENHRTGGTGRNKMNFPAVIFSTRRPLGRGVFLSSANLAVSALEAVWL